MRHKWPFILLWATSFCAVALVLRVWVAPGIADFAADQKAYGVAVYIWRPLAFAGDENAQTYLALSYENGWGLAADRKKAIHWYQRAAEGGSPVAQFNLAEYYLRGVGVAPNPSMALYWLRKAAAQNAAPAQNNLGMMYAEGIVGAQDLVEAAMWFRIAARNGHPNAQANLVSIEKRMTAAQIADAQSFAERWRP